MAANTLGRQVVVPLTNKSGGGVIAGDVVVVDTTNNDAFTTTTSAATTNIVGIAQDTIASNAVGRVLLQGYAALVNVNASVTRGHYGATHTVAKQAAGAGASRTGGTFCKFLTGGTTPTAAVFNPDTVPSTIRGAVNADGTIAGGTGFTINKTATGRYTITFTVAFAAQPVVLVQGYSAAASQHAFLYSVPTTSAVDIETTNFAGSDTDKAFNFIASAVS